MIKSPYKMGWILVMFDLPVMDPEERRIASRFRKQLLEDGYSMLNFSVYARPCPDWTRMRKHAERLESFTPSGGNIHVFFITDRQWQDSITVIGKDYQRERKMKEPPPMEQMAFW